jgi:hypothetical protein
MGRQDEADRSPRRDVHRPVAENAAGVTSLGDIRV